MVGKGENPMQNTTVTILSIAYNKYGDRIELLGDEDTFYVVHSFEGAYGHSRKLVLHHIGNESEGRNLFNRALADFRDLQSTRAA